MSKQMEAYNLTCRARLQLPLYQFFRSGRNRRIIPKPRQPMDYRLLAEPRDLPLGVAARGLSNCFSSGSASDRAFQMRVQFAVPDEVERLGTLGNAAASK